MCVLDIINVFVYFTYSCMAMLQFDQLIGPYQVLLRRSKLNLMLYTQLCLYEQRGTKYISHLILERGSQLLLRYRWRDIHSDRGLLVLYLLGASECQHLHSLASRIARDVQTPLFACLSLARLSILWLDWLNLTAWFSYHVVSFWLHTCSTGPPRCTAIPCLLITTWQLFKAYMVTRNKPKIHVICLYNTESDGNEGVLRIPLSSSIIGTLPFDYLMSYPGHPLAGSYLSTEMQLVYSTEPAEWAGKALICHYL